MLPCAKLEFSVIYLVCVCVCVYFLSSAAGLDASNQASTHELTIPNDVSALIPHMTFIHHNSRLAIALVLVHNCRTVKLSLPLVKANRGCSGEVCDHRQN